MTPTKTKITFLNGMITTLTTGEINAIEAYAQMNGTDPASPQYHPGYVHHTTTKNLVSKGIFIMGSSGVPHFAKGLLPLYGRTTHAQADRRFTLTGALAEVMAKNPSETSLLAAEDFQVGFLYWPAREGYEKDLAIAKVTLHEATYQVQRDGEFVTPMLVTHTRRNGSERTFEKGTMIAIKGPWKIDD